MKRTASTPRRPLPDLFDNPAATCLSCGWEGRLADTVDNLAGCKCPDCRHRARCPQCAVAGQEGHLDLTPAPLNRQSQLL